MEGIVPTPAFEAEFSENQSTGAAILEAMIRESIFDQQTMPPPELLNWYVHNVVYRFIHIEHAFVYGVPAEHEEGLSAALVELGMLIEVLNKNKQLGLQHALSQVLRTRTLKLPPLYDATLGGRLPG